MVTVDETKLNYSFGLAAREGTDVEVWIVNRQKDLITKAEGRVQEDDVSKYVDPGFDSTGFTGWRGRGTPDLAGQKDGEYTAALVFKKGDEEVGRVTADNWLTIGSVGGGDSVLFAADDSGLYACGLEDLSGRTVEIRKEKLNITGALYYDRDVTMESVSLTLSSGSYSKGNKVKVTFSSTGSGLENRVRAAIPGDRLSGAKQQGTFTIPVNRDRGMTSGVYKVEVRIMMKSNDPNNSELYGTTLVTYVTINAE